MHWMRYQNLNGSRVKIHAVHMEPDRIYSHVLSACGQKLNPARLGGETAGVVRCKACQKVEEAR